MTTQHTPGPLEAIEDAISWLSEATPGTDQHERGMALKKAKVAFVGLLKAARMGWAYADYCLRQEKRDAADTKMMEQNIEVIIAAIQKAERT